VLTPLAALLVAMLVGHLLIIIYGASPAKIFQSLLGGTWGNVYGFGQVLFKATPLILTGLAVALPFRAGLFNIGGEGQMVLGAMATGILGIYLPVGTPSVMAVLLCAAAGFMMGAIWGGIPGYFKARFGAHEVITTIMMNFIALALVNYFMVSYFSVSETLHTRPIIENAHLSRLSSYIGAFRGSAVNMSLILALLISGCLYFVLFKTRTGYQIQALGLNPKAAEYGGVNLKRTTMMSMALGGGMAGLVGMNFVLGYKYYFEEGFSGGLGFMGIAVAMLGRNHPGGIVLAALLFGTLSQGGFSINAMVPREIVDVMQAVVILAVVAGASEVQSIVAKEVRGE
jgi:simple sugar transport system permease protein